MGVEIERKFLVSSQLVPGSALRDGAMIVQGYLSEDPAVRVRLKTMPDPIRHQRTKAFLTIKGPGMHVRSEFEYPIPVEDAEEMLKLCNSSLRKTRYTFTQDGSRWELDHFHGALEGLWMAEIELDVPDAEFVRPAWLGKEVTEDSRYTNVALARSEGPPSPEEELLAQFVYSPRRFLRCPHCNDSTTMQVALDVTEFGPLACGKCGKSHTGLTRHGKLYTRST